MGLPLTSMCWMEQLQQQWEHTTGQSLVAMSMIDGNADTTQRAHSRTQHRPSTSPRRVVAVEAVRQLERRRHHVRVAPEAVIQPCGTTGSEVVVRQVHGSKGRVQLQVMEGAMTAKPHIVYDLPMFNHCDSSATTRGAILNEYGERVSAGPQTEVTKGSQQSTRHTQNVTYFDRLEQVPRVVIVQSAERQVQRRQRVQHSTVSIATSAGYADNGCHKRLHSPACTTLIARTCG
jgi:hypothetical protein